MKNMTLAAIARAVEGELHIGKNDINKEASCVVVDSRLIKEDGIFVATKGERVDGHSFIDKVFEQGALGVICEVPPQNEDYSYILVKDSFDALKKAAKYYRSQLSVKVIGIIGSVGKTSTKEIVASVLSEKYKVLKTQGNFNNEVGVPLTICRIDSEHEVAVIEMGISDFGEMGRLSDIARPDAVIMTNIGPCHLENLGDLDGVLKAKTEVFKYLKPGSSILLNKEDEKLSSIAGDEGHNIIYYGNGSDYYADNIDNHGLLGSSFTIHALNEAIDANINLPGRHMITNALAATAAGKMMGLSLWEIQIGIEKARGIEGRSNIIKTKDYVLIDDCYNANPKSMQSAIDMTAYALGRKVAILGDMFELGDNENNLHAIVGKYAIEHGIDLLICVGRLSKYMYDAAAGSLNTMVMYFENKEDLLNALKDTSKSLLKKDDTVLIKASHGMGFSEVVDLLRD